jgi:hypothetical protein
LKYLIKFNLIIAHKGELKMKFLLLLIQISFIGSFTFPQTQQRIEWPSLADSPWPILTGDAQSTGRSEFVGPKSANPYIIWRADLPLGIFWGPTIGYNDILYFGSDGVDPNYHNPFFAYYPNGNEWWRYETNEWIPNNTSALITKDSTVYFKSNSGDIYAFTSSGSLKWKSNIAFGQKLQLSIDRIGNIYTYKLDSLVVVDSDGEIVLKKRFEKICTPITFSPDGTTIYFKTGYFNSGYDKFIIAADLLGDTLWTFKVKNTNEAPVVVDNQGNIYFYAHFDSLGSWKGYLFAFTEDGKVKWKYPLSIYGFRSAPTIDPNGNIVFYYQKDEMIGSFNYIVSLSQDGELNWEYPLEPDEDVYFAQVSHGLVSDAEGNIYFGSWKGNYFYALNRFGELLWKIPLNGHPYYSYPAIGSNGTLYLGTTSEDSSIDNLIAISDYPSSIDDENELSEFRLYQNYPNPFNPSTSIEYKINQESFVSIKVYNILGDEIVTLVNELKPAALHKVEFNISNKVISSGVYFYRIEAISNDSKLVFRETKKLILLK